MTTTHITPAAIKDAYEAGQRVVREQFAAIADQWDSMAERDRELAESRIERAEALIVDTEDGVPSEVSRQREYAQYARGCADTNTNRAKQIRGVLG